MGNTTPDTNPTITIPGYLGNSTTPVIYCPNCMRAINASVKKCACGMEFN